MPVDATISITVVTDMTIIREAFILPTIILPTVILPTTRGAPFKPPHNKQQIKC